MSAKYLTPFALALSLLISACGGSMTPGVVHAAAPAASPSPTPTPSPTPVPTPPPFPPAQPLVCTGSIQTGQQCAQSDGISFYRIDQFSVATRADGHGTFQVISEAGLNTTGLRQITFTMPQTINVLEVHGTGSIDSWCNNNGVVTTWDSTDATGVNGHLVGGKNFFFNAGDTVSYVIPQVLFPQPIPIASLTQNIFPDLCAITTVHWVLYGSF